MSLRDRNGHAGMEWIGLGEAVSYAREADEEIRAAGFGNHHLAKRLHAALQAIDRAREELIACGPLIDAVSSDLNNNTYDLSWSTQNFLCRTPPPSQDVP